MYKPLGELKRNYKKNHKTFTTFLRGLSNRKVKNIDGLARELHLEATKEINCTKCANCCKVMTPTYNKSDLKRISKHVGMTPEEYTKKYLEKDEKGDMVHKKTPCHFLLPNNYCGIYEIRPSDCRGFPHTQARDFKHGISIHKENMESCPIVYRIVERMYEKVIVNKEA